MALLHRGRGLLPAAGVGVAAAWSAAAAPVVAVATVAGGTALVLGLLNAEVVLLALVASLQWEGVLAWPSEELGMVKLLGLLLLVAWALRAAANAEAVRLPGALVAPAAVGMSVLVALVFSPDPAAGLLDASRYALFVVFFFLVVQMVRTRAQVRRVLVVVVASGAAAAWGLGAFLFGGRERAGGPIGDPNDFAYVLASLTPLAVFLIRTDDAHRRRWQACLVVLAAAILATLSRGALVGLAALVVWSLATGRASLTRLRPVLGVLAVLVALVVGVLLVWGPQANQRLDAKEAVAADNVDSRRALWSGAVEMWADHPLVGVGPGRFSVEVDDYVHDDPLAIRDPLVHNTYLQSLAELGALGLGALLALLAMTWQLLAGTRRRATAVGDDEGAQLALAFQATTIVAAVSACFLSVALTTPFWLIGALAVATALASGPEPVAPRR